MKISPHTKIKEPLSPPTRVKRKSSNFSSEFQFSNHQEKKRHLKQLLDKIQKKGKHIIATNSIRAVSEYKKMIQEYLSLILESGYQLKRIQNPWDGQNMTIVEIIDQELKELSDLVLNKQKDALDIINKVDTIQGLLLDAYQ